MHVIDAMAIVMKKVTGLKLFCTSINVMVMVMEVMDIVNRMEAVMNVIDVMAMVMNIVIGLKV